MSGLPAAHSSTCVQVLHQAAGGPTGVQASATCKSEALCVLCRMAPEILIGQQCSYSADIYSYGERPVVFLNPKSKSHQKTCSPGHQSFSMGLRVKMGNVAMCSYLC